MVSGLLSCPLPLEFQGATRVQPCGARWPAAWSVESAAEAFGAGHAWALIVSSFLAPKPGSKSVSDL